MPEQSPAPQQPADQVTAPTTSAPEAEAARQSIATATVGGFGALAFVPLASIVKTFIDPATVHPAWETRTLVFLVGVCFLTELAFFFGIQTYLRRRVSASYGWWLFDFGATIVTLGLLVFLGTTATPSTKSWFVGTLGLIYLVQGVWAAIHLAESPTGRAAHVTRTVIVVVVVIWFAALVFGGTHPIVSTVLGVAAVVASVVAASASSTPTRLPLAWALGDPLLGIVVLLVFAWDRGMMALASFWIIGIAYAARLVCEGAMLVHGRLE